MQEPQILINRFPFAREINMVEIERKFLVTSTDFKKEAFNQTRILQGFLNSHKERTVRVRLRESKGYLTVKGLSSQEGLTRYEWESEISKQDAENLLKLCEKGVIDKVRYEIKVDDHIFEVDEFFGDNEGLILAEIELKHISELFKKPSWLGEEVTGNIKYYNSQLSKQPFNTWHQ
ncbi:CYTH domain-containing protein [Flavobacteriaceae bacterium MAR_2010_72]|nr:CYTH domain-containing protein [Flavobacteriaceae bacterium MAR_2010_72]TVZ58404.1 CYTH domain-containing protein [Flavobacteriaceae bacterium MAR_2010_105]